jgi:hypothetical protein
MNHRTRAIVLGLASLLAVSAVASASATDSLSQYNLIVLGNFNGTTHVHGASYIGGSITNGGALDFAVDLYNSAAPGQTLLTLGGTYVTQPNNLAGHIAATDSATTQALANSLQDYSTQLSLLPGTALTSLNNVTVSSTGGVNTQVFTVTEAVFETTNMNFLISSLDADDYIVFNVAGTDVAMSGGSNFNDSGAIDWSHVLWNFYESETLSLKGFYGNILAPNATLTLTNDIYGNTAVAQLNGYGQIHINGTPSLPPTATVPAPSSALLAGLGLLSAATFRRRLTTFGKRS